MQGSFRPGPREDLGQEMRSACRGHPGSQQERGQEPAAPEKKVPAWRGRRPAWKVRAKAVRAPGCGLHLLAHGLLTECDTDLPADDPAKHVLSMPGSGTQRQGTS